MSDNDNSMRCAEYVLGTATAQERAELERAMAGEPALREEVRRWEDWLNGLNDVIPEVEPGATVWPAIAARIRPDLPGVASAPPSSTAQPPEADRTLPLRRSRARWRAATIAFGALAAGLALFIVQDRLQPTGASYLAVVNRSGDLPALIVNVDTRSDTVSIRSVAAETPPDRVLELWYIGGGRPPRALGLLENAETRVTLPASVGRADIAGATLAVSVEPRGGSTTGAPTGEVVYSGKLIRDR